MSPEVACPEKERLRRSLDPDDPMPDSERRSIEEHLESCNLGCKVTVAEMLRGYLSPASTGSLATSESTLAPEMPRSDVSPPGYELLEVLGTGGQSIVYQARQRGLNRLVAVKIMHRGPHAAEEDRARFEREGLAVARLKHPQIVEIYDVGEVDGQMYCILEFLPGGSLAAKLARLPQPPSDAAALTHVLARAIHWAHQQGIVHRDLKPANVLLTADGQPKITDFGLARRIDDDAGLTHTGSVMGTPSYMAPEQARGLTREIGPSADIYALGAVLYEMLTGRPPFLGTTPWEVLSQVLDQDPIPPSRLQPKIDVDLETICLKCLAKEPHRRYQNAACLAEDLRRFQAGEPILARATPWWEHAWRWARRNPAVASLLGTLAIVVTSALIGLSVLYLNAERQRRLAEQNEAEAQAVTRFLEENLLSAARPKGREGGFGYDVSLKDALDHASEKIDTAFAGQPLREAAVRNTLGLTYYHLGIFEEPKEHLAKAYRLRREHLGPDHPDTLTSEHNLALQRSRQDEFDEAILLARDALERRRRVLGRLHPETLSTQLALGYACRKIRRFEEASAAILPAAADCERTLGPHHPYTLTGEFEMGALLWDQGKPTEAIPLKRKAYEGRRQNLGREHPDTLRSMGNLGVSLASLGKFEEAEPLCRETWMLRRTILGPTHRETLWSQGFLAAVLSSAGKFAEAETLAREAADALATMLPAHHPELIDHYALVGEILLGANRPAEAETILRECLTNLTSPERKTGPGKSPADGGYWRAVAVRSLLGRSLALQEKVAEAEPLLLQGYEELVSAKSAPVADQTRAAEWIVDFYDRQQLPEKANQWRKQAGLQSPR